jgi:NAD(P)-dependent dehydrogenase (short-subunit alcohol dehydrogenase family)
VALSAIVGYICAVTELGTHSTTDDVLAGIDLSGTRVLVTGVSSGLGLETARAAAAHGADVVGTARDLAKAADALAAHPGLGIEVAACDLASLAGVRACTDALAAGGDEYDVVIANAGVMNHPFGRTVDGFEMHFGTNHVGHFVLVNRLRPLIRDGGRVIVLASAAHHASDVSIDDPGFERSAYNAYEAYGRSKTANILFAGELDRRLRGRGIRAVSLHPGGIPTALLRHTTPELMHQMVARAMVRADGTKGDPPEAKTVEQGAATTVWAAFVAAADEVGGRYCEDCRVAEVTDAGNDGVRPYAVDRDRSAALWAATEELVGEWFA